MESVYFYHFSPSAGFISFTARWIKETFVDATLKGKIIHQPWLVTSHNVGAELAFLESRGPSDSKFMCSFPDQLHKPSGLWNYSLESPVVGAHLIVPIGGIYIV